MRRFARVIPAGGFTLQEIIIVLVIVGIISAIALPRMGNDPVMLSTQVDQLAGDIRYVQARRDSATGSISLRRVIP